MELNFDELGSFENEQFKGLFEFGEGASATPGKVPLLIETPTGDRKQVEVNVDATVGDLKSLVNSFGDPDGPEEGGPGFDLVFGNNSLGDDDEPLWKTTVLDTYETAGGFLRTVEDREQGASDGANAIKALDSTIAVVENVKEGGNDFDAMVQLALRASLHIEHMPNPSARNQNGELSELLANPRIEAARQASVIVTSASQPAPRSSPRVPDVIKTLSDRMPEVFSPKAANNVSRNWEAMTPLSSLPKDPPTKSSFRESQNEPVNDTNSNWLTSLMESWEDSILKGGADAQIPGGTTPKPTRKRGADSVDMDVSYARNTQPKYDREAYEDSDSLIQGPEERELQEHALGVKDRLSRLQDVLTIRMRPDGDR